MRTFLALPTGSTRPEFRVSRPLALFLAVALALGSVLGGASAAQAAVALTVGIQSTNATTQPSGSDFTYQINLACSGTNAPACRGAELIIPLAGSVDMSGWDYDLVGGPPGFIQSWSVSPDGLNLVAVLSDSIPAGSSQAVVLTVTPPNLTTPDGTTWQLLPRVESADADMDDTVAPTAAQGTATAAVSLVVAKTSARSFYAEGDLIDYTITATCPASPPAGSLYAGSLTVTDTVPAGIEPVVASISGGGVWDPATRLITWTYPDATSVPVACGGAGPATQTFSATLGSVGTAGTDDLAPFAEVINVVEATALPRGGGTPSTGTAERTIVALDTGDDPLPGTHALGKSSAGPLNISDDDDPDLRGTYPGRWLPSGDNTGSPASLLDPAPARYVLTPRIQYEEFQYEIRDAVPCLDDPTGPNGSVYVGSATRCVNPAFHVLGVRIDFSGTAPGAGYVPRFVDLAGVERDLEPDVSGGSWRGWVVPAAFIGQVSEIVIPRDDSQEFRRADTITVSGYADPTVERLDVLRNVATIDWFLRDGAAPTDSQTSQAADLFILDESQLGVRNSMTQTGGVTGPTAAVSLGATLFTPRPPAHDLVVTDLLPAGSTLGDDPADLGVTLTVDGTVTPLTAPDFVLEALDDYADGRVLLRLTVRQDALPAQAGRFDIALEAFELIKPPQPGVYTNTAQVFYDDTSLSSACAPGGYRSADPLLLRGDPAAVEAHCEASATFRSATSASGQFQLTKTVQGDYDPLPQAFPNVGHVSLTDGTARYRIEWTNTGAPTLEGVVLYDILPHVGDTGVIGQQAGEPRGSEFRPLLALVDAAPTDVVVEYSAAGNPCRPEVYPTQVPTTCTDDWTTDPADLGGLDQVLSMRLVSSAQYATGEGFGIGFEMSVPTVEADQIAWNSVAGYAQDLAGIALEPAEPPKVGITASDDRFGLAKQVDRAAAEPGETLSYDVTVSNQGTRVSVPTQVMDVLPAGVSFVAATAAGSYDAASRTVTWDVPALARGAVSVFTVEVVVDARQPDGSIINAAALVNPAGYSPPLVDAPCAADPLAACAETIVPVTVRALGMTGRELGAGGAVLGVVLLLGGFLLVVWRRRQARVA